MSKPAKFRRLNQHIAQQLKEDDALQDEFEIALRILIGKYDMNLRDVVSILDPMAIIETAPDARSPSRRV